MEGMMPALEKRVDVSEDRRCALREQVLLGAAAITIQKSQSVIVEDVCPVGAKLCGRNLPPVATQLLIRAGAMQILAAVAWLKRDWCGITFDLPLDDEGVELLKQEGRWANLMGIDPVPDSGPGNKIQPHYQLAY